MGLLGKEMGRGFFRPYFILGQKGASFQYCSLMRKRGGQRKMDGWEEGSRGFVLLTVAAEVASVTACIGA